MMSVAQWMSKGAYTCSPSDTLARAAQLMWDHDIGSLPVVTDDGRTIGMITDRDVCMAAYTQGKRLDEIPVSVAASGNLVSVHPGDGVDLARALMEAARIRRLPVVDEHGRTVGLVGLGDLARNWSVSPDGISADSIARTLAAVSQGRAAMEAGPDPAAKRPKHGAVFHVRWVGDGWDVFDRRGKRVSTERVYTQAAAVIHAKELARREASAQIIVHDTADRVTSDFFYQRDEREALGRDDSVPTLAASQPVHAHHH